MSLKTQNTKSDNSIQLSNLPLQSARPTISFDPNVKMAIRDEEDVKMAIERLKQMGHEVEELRYHGELVGYRVGDMYIARRPRTWYEPESWAVAKIPDADVGYKWAVGYRYRTEWGDLNYIKKELEKKAERKALDDWMAALEQYGYKVRKVPWESGAVPGFTYIIEKDGKKVGEVQLAEIGDRLHLVKAGIPSAIDDPIAATRYLIYRHELGPYLERYGNIGGYSQQSFLIALAAGEIDVEEAKRLLAEKEREYAIAETQKGKSPIEDVKEKVDKLVEELKKVAEGVSWRNWEEKQREFLRLRDELTSLTSQYPSLFDKVNEAIGEVGRKISAVAKSLEEILAKAAGRESFFADVGDGMKVAIGFYKVNPKTGAFHLVLREGEHVVGYIRDDGEPVVTLRTRNMSEASTEYERLIRGEPDRELADRKPEEETSRRETELSPNAPLDQPNFVRGIAGNAAYIAHNVASALSNVANFVKGAVTSVLGGVGPLLQSAGQRLAAVVNPPLVKAATIEDTQFTFVKRPETAHDESTTSSVGYRPADYIVKLPEESGASSTSGGGYRPVDYVVAQEEVGKKEPELDVSSTSTSNAASPPEQEPADKARRGGGRHHAHMRLLMT